MSTLTELGQRIMLDRYAQKDPSRDTLKSGDMVVALVDGGREPAEVLSVNMQDRTAAIEILATQTIRERHPIDQMDRLLETTPEQIWDRVATGISSVEPDIRDRSYFKERFKWLLEDFRFVPAGRILTAAGTDQQLTAYNCYVIPNIPDSRGGIFQSVATMAEIMSRGGGVGLNISSLRPKNAYVAGVNGRSSGAVSWANLFSVVTGLIEQAGSRRGAAMIMMNDWHPEIFDFINAKRNSTNILNANISVAISDAFMEAVESDGDWSLRFPDTKHPAYNDVWDGDLENWESGGFPVIVYRTLKAREIWNAIIESAWASAEPGVFFLDRYNKMSNSNYYPEGQIICCNPCAEQGLPAWGVCNLGALNLPKFYAESGLVDWTNLRDAVYLAVRFLDNVIDWTPYFFEENEKQQKAERRVGLGIMGLAELLLMNGLRYGSDEAVKFTEELMKFIRDMAYEASVRIAIEKDPFPQFRADGFLASGFAQTLPEQLRKDIAEHGIRNVTLLTVAPTGTTGTMVNTSTGVEPYFAWEWTRKSRLGDHTEYAAPYQRFLEAHPGEPIPDYFVTAMELTPLEHVRMQAAVQKYVDTSISKTVNAPNDYTVEQASELYLALYRSGCKGGTIYRDGSRFEQVLHLKEAVEVLTCPECGEEVKDNTCDVPCEHCGFMGCAAE